MNFIEEYIDKIKTGEIIVGKKVKQLYLKIIEPIIKDEHPIYYFNEKEGSRFIKFAEGFCRQSKGEWAGKLLVLLLFQKAKYQCIFGILRRDDNTRRFKEVFDVRGRKNLKSTEHSALALYLTMEEVGAELYVAATVAAQARRIWDDSQSMIDQSKDLREAFKYKVFPRPIIYTQRKGVLSKFMVLSKNVKALDGLNASAATIDEVHELPRFIYDVLKQSMSTRKEPILSMITTAGFVREALFDDMYSYCTKILDEVIEADEIFPLIYELDDESEMFNEDMWIKANPAIDIVKSRKQLRTNVARTKEDPNFANTVKVKDFNVIGVENKTWLSYDVLNNEEVYTEKELEKFNNTIVLGGFDLSRIGDITAFTTLLFDKEKNKIIAETMYWVAQRFLEVQTQNTRVPYNAWVDRGLIRVSGKDKIDYHDIANYVAGNFRKHGWTYLNINYDSWSAEYLVQELAAMGYARDYCLKPVRQGFKTLSIPMQMVETHLRDKTLVYQNNPVTKWMLSNIELVQDRNGNYMPKKSEDKQGRKIDGPATILNCYVSLCENIDYYMKY